MSLEPAAESEESLDALEPDLQGANESVTQIAVVDSPEVAEGDVSETNEIAEVDTEPATEPKASRAGRNLPAAIGVGVSLLTLLGLALAFRPEPFLALVVVAVCLGLVEFVQALRQANIHVPQPLLLVGGFLMPLAAYFAGAIGLLTTFVVLVAVVTAWQALNTAGGYQQARTADYTSSIFALIYVPFLASFVVLLLNQYRGNWRVALLILLAVANDTGGYIAGVLFGKHPMAPSVSPKKSWEGFIGSIILTTLVGIIGARLALDVPFLPQAGSALFSAALPLGLLLGLACAVAATLGDLAESLIKRDIGLKDMGNLLPGHGGVLDRLDSVLIVAPAVYLILSLAGAYVRY